MRYPLIQPCMKCGFSGLSVIFTTWPCDTWAQSGQPPPQAPTQDTGIVLQITLCIFYHTKSLLSNSSLGGNRMIQTITIAYIIQHSKQIPVGDGDDPDDVVFHNACGNQLSPAGGMMTFAQSLNSKKFQACQIDPLAVRSP